MQVQLLEYVAAMRIHGVNAQLKKVGNFLVGSAFGKKLQDLAFARSQKIVAILHLLVAYLANIIFQQHLADHRAEERLSVGNRSHCSNQVRLRRVLQNVCARPSFQGPEDVAFIGVHAENHYLGLGRLIGDLLGSLDPVELWHTDIENGNVGMLLGDQLNGFPSIASLRYNFEVGLLLEQQSQARPNDGVIVSEQDANLSQVLSAASTARILHHSRRMRTRPR